MRANIIMIRLGVTGLVVCLGAGAVAACNGHDGPKSDKEPPRTARLIRDGVLVRTPAAALSVCGSASSQFTRPARCPAVIPRSDGAWGPARVLDRTPCEYLVELQPRAFRGAPQEIWHLLVGGRCRRFDLRTSGGGRWPARGFLAADLRLVGVHPLTPGQSGRGRPARPRVVKRLQIGDRPGLLLRYAPQPLTSVHTGHLAIVWNERSAAYVVSGHPADSPTPAQNDRAIRALRETALAMYDGATPAR